MLHCTSRCTLRGELCLSKTFFHQNFSKGHKNKDNSWKVRSMHPNTSQSESDADTRSLLKDIERIKTRTGSYPDKKPLSKVQGAVQETIGWLRHAIQDPEDFSSAAIGRMVSKEYGKHEPPHTEHHMWRTGHTPRPSPPSSPMARNQQQQSTRSALATPTGTSTAPGGMSPTLAAIAKTVGAAAAPAGPVGLEPVRDAKGSCEGGNAAQMLGSGGGTGALRQATGQAALPEQRDTSGI